MSSLQSHIESLLFIAIKPLTLKALQDITKASRKDVEAVVEALATKHNTEASGIALQRIGDKVQMVTAPDNGQLISEYIKDEATGDLTPASLETLTVIAYRGPISKTELELIRGVNCTLILRNLLMRGLIEEQTDASGLMTTYQVTFEFLKYLGMTDTAQLPDYAALNDDKHLQELLNPQQAQEASAQTASDTSELQA